MSPALTKLSVFIACFLAPMTATQAGIMFNVNQQFGSDALDTIVLVEQQTNALKFTLTVDDSITGNIGDLRGIFFHVADESLLSGLTAAGLDVTDQAYSANSVSNLGNGANVNGSLNPFDAGIEIGSQGIGQNDIRTTMFVLSHSSQALDQRANLRSTRRAQSFALVFRQGQPGFAVVKFVPTTQASG